MVKMHMVAASIALSGDIHNVVRRAGKRAVSWPELGIIQLIHGEGCLSDVVVLSEIDTTPMTEKTRLQSIYGKTAELAYPGRSPPMEMLDPTFKAPAEAEPDKPAKTAKAGKAAKPTPVVLLPAAAPLDEVEDEDPFNADETQTGA